MCHCTYGRRCLVLVLSGSVWGVSRESRVFRVVQRSAFSACSIVCWVWGLFMCGHGEWWMVNGEWRMVNGDSMLSVWRRVCEEGVPCTDVSFCVVVVKGECWVCCLWSLFLPCFPSMLVTLLWVLFFCSRRLENCSWRFSVYTGIYPYVRVYTGI